MTNAPFRFGPLALTNSYTTNILNPGTTTGGVNSTGSPYGNLTILLYHVRVINKTNGAVTLRLYVGATGANAAGTESFFATDRSVPANSEIEWWGRKPLSVSDFLVGGASAGTSLTIEGEGEIGIAF